VLLRGHSANPWDLGPWELLADDHDVSVLVTGSNLYDVDGLRLRRDRVRTPRDVLPGGRAAGAVAYALGERYLGLGDRLAGADVVHSAEIGTWFSAQAARLKARLGFRLVVTVWETIPWLGAYRWPRERGYRQATLPAVDLFLPTTERARRTLLLEGADPDRVEVCPPGVDLERFAGRPDAPPGRVVLSPGRLVWEKGHQDVLRAMAALRQGLDGHALDDVRVVLVGDGPEADRLRRHAAELGIADAVEIRAHVPYDEMPGLYASAACVVLASLPTRGWEEQFGMVLVEAMAAGVPIVAADSGAIPEVVGDRASLVAPGDWPGLARALAGGALDGGRVDYGSLERFSTAAAADRLRAAYRRVLS
jgi:glycosyltransferase involved in cell wall biosynthesis